MFEVVLEEFLDVGFVSVFAVIALQDGRDERRNELTRRQEAEPGRVAVRQSGDDQLLRRRTVVFRTHPIATQRIQSRILRVVRKFNLLVTNLSEKFWVQFEKCQDKRYTGVSLVGRPKNFVLLDGRPTRRNMSYRGKP